MTLLKSYTWVITIHDHEIAKITHNVYASYTRHQIIRIVKMLRTNNPSYSVYVSKVDYTI